jgi:hypothetical protein
MMVKLPSMDPVAKAFARARLLPRAKLQYNAGMASIQLDDATAQGLRAIAAANGLSLEDYLRTLAVAQQSQSTPLSADELDRQLDQLTFSGPSLPADFSRADIYADHD